MNPLKLLFILSVFFIPFICFSSSIPESELQNSTDNPYIIVAYVTAGSKQMPNPRYMTHINYAFGHVNETFDGVNISNEEKLKKISALKKDFPHLKVMLSIGGWTSGRFSEMAADPVTRESFAKDCKRIVDEFDIDGIDMDWEYPTSSAAGISSSPDDTENFTLLMRDIRNTIGKDKLLTLASVHSARFVDFPAIDPYIDFVNIMTYDMGRPPYHNSPLYQSENVRRLSCEEAVDAHVKAGVPLNKLTLGMPFYGHGKHGISDFIDFKDMPSLEGYEERWDEDAQVPYLVNKDGVFACSFDNERSLKAKCEFLMKKGMLGAMYWEYNCDDENATLAKAVHTTLTGK